jgi:hypothetical protein
MPFALITESYLYALSCNKKYNNGDRVGFYQYDTAKIEILCYIKKINNCYLGLTYC